jgi:UDP:flavonoid glycosyltransferase YjiC (YdhE family)
MARFLFVVPPLTGHTNPTVSVARALEARGHQVAWVAHPRAVRPLLPEGATLFELDDHVPTERWEAKSAESRAVRGLAALKFLWEEFFVPLARAMRPGVADAVDRFQPAVLVVDQQALAGALVARQRGMRWATFSTTSAGLVDPLAGLPLVRQWLDDQLAGLERESGLEPTAQPDRSPHLVVAFTTEELVGAGTSFPAHYRFVGPAIAARPENDDFPWPALDPRRKRVLVSLGTVSFEAGERFYRTALEALGGSSMQLVLVAPPRLFDTLPDNVILRPRVPQLALLPHLDAVVCHAGHNTVCETLAHGRPLVVLPIKDDQPVVAEQVERAGAAVRLKFGRVRADELRRAVERVLHEESFAAAAQRIQRSFAAAGGAARAAQLLEELS